MGGVRRGQTALILPAGTVAAVRHAAEVEGRTPAEVVALALEAWVNPPLPLGRRRS